MNALIVPLSRTYIWFSKMKDLRIFLAVSEGFLLVPCHIFPGDVQT